MAGVYATVSTPAKTTLSSTPKTILTFLLAANNAIEIPKIVITPFGSNSAVAAAEYFLEIQTGTPTGTAATLVQTRGPAIAFTSLITSFLYNISSEGTVGNTLWHFGNHPQGVYGEAWTPGTEIQVGGGSAVRVALRGVCTGGVDVLASIQLHI